MTLVKCHLNAVVSENAHFGALDIADCYLGADVPTGDIQPLKTCLDNYPSSLLDELGLSPFLQTDRHDKTFVHADIVKTVPGLTVKTPASSPKTASSATYQRAVITKPPLPRCFAMPPATFPSPLLLTISA
jgi:hypothetical protein